MLPPHAVQTIPIQSQQRIIVISDIHGNLPLFQGLLRKIGFSSDDILILLGDMIEKGTKSLETIRYIMDLQQTHQVYPLCGNCDWYIKEFFHQDKYDESFFKKFLAHPRNQNSTLLQMGREAGLQEEKDLKNLPILRKTIQKSHPEVERWLKNLPLVLETKDYFFVHGGVADMEHFRHLKPWDLMKNDYFYEKNHSFSKYMVVGHCPTTLYRPHIQDASPLLDHRRKIISIDGGCVLKLDGQLNALILEKGDISWDYYDGLPQITALECQNPSTNPLNIRWGHSQVEIIEVKGEFTLCKHLESGRNIQILSSFLHKSGDTISCEDATDYLLPVKQGDVFSLSQVVDGGILGKKDGITGWYWGKYTL